MRELKHNTKKLLSCINDGWKIITFGEIEIEKCKFHHRENLISLEDVDIKKSGASNIFF